MNPRNFFVATAKLRRVLSDYASIGVRKVNPSWPTVYCDFNDFNVFLRYHFTLAFAFSRIPANVIWRFRPRYLIRSVEQGKPIWWKQSFFKFDFLGTNYREKPLVVVTDRQKTYQNLVNFLFFLVFCYVRDSNLFPTLSAGGFFNNSKHS